MTASRRSFTLLFATLSILASALLGAVGPGQLNLEIVDAYGVELRNGIRAKLYMNDRLIAEAAGGSPLTLKDLARGQYQLEIIGSGFRTVSKAIGVTQGIQFLKIGLSLAKIGDPESAGVNVSGKVLDCSLETTTWVKIVGVFTNETAETRVGKDCAFTISDLDGGQYVGLLVEGGTIKDIKVITLTAKPQSIEFRPAPGATQRKPQ